MSLDKNRLWKDMYDAMEAADLESAEAAGIDPPELANTDQKKQERFQQTKVMAEVIFEHLTKYAEVVIPEHEPNSAMTGPMAGPGVHSHSTNLPPITHKRGKIV